MYYSIAERRDDYMIIVHIHLVGPYTDNWGYQENILPLVQSRQGHKVYVICNCNTHLPDGTVTTVKPSRYTIDGVNIIRVNNDMSTHSERINKLFANYRISKLLETINPDVILLHGLGIGLTNYSIKRYMKKHQSCVLYGDIHSTYSNQGNPKNTIISRFARYLSKIMIRSLFSYYKKIFYLTPECKRFAIKEFKTPEEKMRLFPLGFDPIDCDISRKSHLKNELISKYGLSENVIMIAHGGKIIPRRNTDLAIKAVVRCNNPLFHLFIFGDIDKSIKKPIMQLINQHSDSVTYLGHLNHKEYIDLLLASDIGLFPGGESTIWQEAIGCGLPLVLGKSGDISYLDRGGNIIFVNQENPSDTINALTEMAKSEVYKKMKSVAINEGREFFSYDRISRLMTE